MEQELKRGLRSILNFNNEDFRESPVKGALKEMLKITRNLPKIPDYTRQAHVLRDVKHSANVRVNTRGEILTFILNKVLFLLFLVLPFTLW